MITGFAKESKTHINQAWSTWQLKSFNFVASQICIADSIPKKRSIFSTGPCGLLFSVVSSVVTFFAGKTRCRLPPWKTHLNPDGSPCVCVGGKGSNLLSHFILNTLLINFVNTCFLTPTLGLTRHSFLRKRGSLFVYNICNNCNQKCI